MPSKNDLEDDRYLQSIKWAALKLTTWLDQFMEEEDAMGMRIAEVRVRGPNSGKAGYLVTVKLIDGQGGKWVGWGGGDTFTQAMQMVRAKTEKDGLDLRPDMPWEPTDQRKGKPK